MGRRASSLFSRSLSSFWFWLAASYCGAFVSERSPCSHSETKNFRKQVHASRRTPREHLGCLGGWSSLSLVPGFCCCWLHPPPPRKARQHMAILSPLQRDASPPGYMRGPLTGTAAVSPDSLQDARSWSYLCQEPAPSFNSSFSRETKMVPGDCDGFCLGREGGTILGMPANPMGQPNADDLT